MLLFTFDGPQLNLSNAVFYFVVGRGVTEIYPFLKWKKYPGASTIFTKYISVYFSSATGD
jgi:hypothetical protein